ncbi:MAG: GAF domain-containing protein [Cytophagales bacterium]|jgi:PAS domain-containing protein|nr:GAF domain-containing protein [Cytophagales bacterium]
MLFRYIKKNGLIIVIAIVSLLIGISTISFFLNRQIMAKSVLLKSQADKITFFSKEIYMNTLSNADKGLRAYALTRSDIHLGHFNYSLNSRNRAFDSLTFYLNLQRVAVPSAGESIDSYLKEEGELQEILNEYLDLCVYMAGLVKKDSMNEFMMLLNQDNGIKPGTAWDKFNTRLTTFEKSLTQEAQRRYENAISANATIQFILLLVGLPSLYWMIVSLRRIDSSRNKVLEDLRASNIKYLFNPGEMQVDSEKDAIKVSIENLRKASTFVKNVANGNYTLLWEGLTDDNVHLNKETLVGELLKMQNQIKAATDAEQKRTWANEGLNLLGSILQKETNQDLMADKFLSELVKYLKANQGALFVVDDSISENPKLKLRSTYAYNRKKFISKDIFPGEGIAGQAWLEKETIYLREIPGDYVKITSGLGEAPPNNVLIVPLKDDKGNIQGILELASFKIFLQEEISFVERIAETLAITLSSAKGLQQTNNLLRDTQLLTEQMRAQEEEMKQNMEELTATQEEMVRKQLESKNLLASLDSSFCIIELDADSRITRVNEKMLKLTKYTFTDLDGKDFLGILRENESIFIQWQKLENGESLDGNFILINKDGSSTKTDGILIPINGQLEKLDKILFMARPVE